MKNKFCNVPLWRMTAYATACLTGNPGCPITNRNWRGPSAAACPWAAPWRTRPEPGQSCNDCSSWSACPAPRCSRFHFRLRRSAPAACGQSSRWCPDICPPAARSPPAPSPCCPTCSICECEKEHFDTGLARVRSSSAVHCCYGCHRALLLMQLLCGCFSAAFVVVAAAAVASFVMRQHTPVCPPGAHLHKHTPTDIRPTDWLAFELTLTDFRLLF